MRIWQLALPIVLVATATNAWALEPAKHRSLAEKACKDVGLPSAFCQRMGKQAYETDYKEWTNLAAHAQRELGQDRCTAADAAASRVDALAREVVAKTHALDYEAAAIALGRAVHTLQDECAHHGMTNQEHSYYSLTQTCEGTSVSPDVQPEALACAKARTEQVFALVAQALAGSRWDYVDNICVDFDNRDTCLTASLPTPFMACDFLGEHTDWDGEDSRWNGDLVGSALVRAFAGGLHGDAAPAPMCGNNAAAIDPVSPRPFNDNRVAGCNQIDILCLGKTDDPGSIDDAHAVGGCAAGGSSSGFVAFALLGLLVRRRRSATA